MKRWIGRLMLYTLAGTTISGVVVADEPQGGLFRRWLCSSECSQCNDEPKIGPVERAKWNRESGPPVTVRYPVALPGQEVITPTPNVFRRPWNRRGYKCYAHRDSPGCSSFRSTMQFIFGSSRSFFAEPCIPEPSLGDRMLEHRHRH